MNRRDRAIHLTAEGWTAQQIADNLGVTQRTVYRYRQTAGISQPKPPALSSGERDFARRLLLDGCSYNEVARTLGRSMDCVLRNFPGFGWDRRQINEFMAIVRAS